MNNLRKKKALGIAEGVGNDKLQTADLLQKEGFTNEEIAEVMEALDNPAPPPPPEPEKPAKKEKAKSPNEAVDLSGFNYKDQNGNFTGDAFRKYVELVGDHSFKELDPLTNEERPVVGKLRLDDMYDFQLFRVKPIRRARYAGIENSPVDYIGLTITNDQPIHTTRIPVSAALEFNAQILNAHSVAGYGKYYLLKK